MFVVKKDIYLMAEPNAKVEFQCISHFAKEKEAEKAFDAIYGGYYRGFLNVVQVKGDYCNFCNTYFPILSESNV